MTGKFTRMIGGGMLALTFCSGLLLALPAEDAQAAVRAELRPDFIISIDGSERDFFNAKGEELQPIVYDGTTYLPVRAIGELIGKNVDWNQSTLTLTLAGKRTTPEVKGSEDKNAKRRAVAVDLRDDMIIKVDDSVRRFTDANGNRVYPMVHDGATYLPLRAIGELMGKNVEWNSKTFTVTLADSLITDADTFSGTDADGDEKPDNLIMADEAFSKALKHAGLKEKNVQLTGNELKVDDGDYYYNIEFTANGKAYDYEIDAVTGKIVDWDVEAVKDNKDNKEDKDNKDEKPESDKNRPGNWNDKWDSKFDKADVDKFIGEVKAAQAALANIAKATVEDIRKCELEYDDGRAVYEIKIVFGGKEYEAEIDALTGKLISWEIDD